VVPEVDIGGIFSRRFIVGFFLPAFFGIVALKLLVDPRALPHALRTESGGTQFLILLGVALLLGMLLWGLHIPLIRFFEGYWLIAPVRPLRSAPWPQGDGYKHGIRATLGRALDRVRWEIGRGRLAYGTKRQARWICDRARLVAIKADPSLERTLAARDLTKRFPPADDLVLPTELGNVIRAFETHPRERYGLDGIAIWPRIAAILSEKERLDIDEVTTDVAFWINGLVIVGVFGSLLFAERLWHRPGGAIVTFAIEIAVVISVTVIGTFIYRQLISAAIRWGEPVRAAFDGHRLELYDRLGVRRPVTADDDKVVGDAINRMLVFGEPLPDRVRAAHTPSTTSPDAGKAH